MNGARSCGVMVAAGTVMPSLADSVSLNLPLHKDMWKDIILTPGDSSRDQGLKSPGSSLAGRILYQSPLVAHLGLVIPPQLPLMSTNPHWSQGLE
ncbi:hypothetical protein RRG08_001653 [Elysia crispata]|uniref:Uncharacterized protein n=1 Tax=Elysia crispata TaxID=231223 RepID=A0AAE1AKE7_9GAST|nr:hypothetical protein RRG08_001653 [Elysia crispata]